MWSTALEILQAVLLASLSVYAVVFFFRACWMTGVYLGALFGVLLYVDIVAPLLSIRKHPSQWYIDIEHELPKLIGGLVAVGLMVDGVKYERGIAR